MQQTYRPLHFPWSLPFAERKGGSLLERVCNKEHIENQEYEMVDQKETLLSRQRAKLPCWSAVFEAD